MNFMLIKKKRVHNFYFYEIFEQKSIGNMIHAIGRTVQRQVCPNGSVVFLLSCLVQNLTSLSSSKHSAIRHHLKNKEGGGMSMHGRVRVCVWESLVEAITQRKQDFSMENSLSFGRFHILLKLKTIKFKKSWEVWKLEDLFYRMVQSLSFHL